jgi:hypothetical protein
MTPENVAVEQQPVPNMTDYDTGVVKMVYTLDGRQYRLVRLKWGYVVELKSSDRTGKPQWIDAYTLHRFDKQFRLLVLFLDKLIEDTTVFD